ncbi:MFS transporter [Streptomyces acidiscabies]|uniref:MFS transporter n=1 Tax=Streptomyces acidiscabies TaxID=42234 RepID=A0AAP6ECB5_9ACTN|nr:MFS transporter [Streptomyces acidiscabies]MBP5941324.1 MFS transporter [Streptomyces sp. LBUM 1476]MBZ3912675.1 MFS transporter [Streptomyces acidiscabies]MDX2958158.1 MFS transporter [Streptomyces acidiscabies]MDX3018525.1 MFS transporter [Streptomyces acidiscabies]MDX3791172.1 MFS transporter [Streptomyces acidiscabies]
MSQTTETPDTTSLTKTAEEPASRHRWWVLAMIGIAQLMVTLDATIVNIAMPSAQADLGFSDGDRTWIVTAYSLAFGSLLLLGGRIADLFGRKVAFLVGVGGFAAASALAGAATNFEVLVVGRTLQGLFGALLAPAALSLLTTTFTDAKERARAFGIYGAIAGSGAAVGLLLGGVLTEYLDWRWTLYVNLALAVIPLVGGWILLKRTAREPGAKLDIPGTLLVTTGLFAVVYGFSMAESHDWSSPRSWGFLTVGGILLAAFTWWQTKASHPLLPLRVLLDRDRGASFAVMLISSAGMFGVFLFLTYYLQLSLGFSAVKTGLAFLPMVGGLMVAATLATSFLVPRIGPKIIVPLGMALGAVGLVWMTDLGLDSTYVTHVMPPLILTGLGIGLVMAPAMSLATSGVAAHDAGVASAAVNTMQQIGGSIGTALLNTLAASAATNYLDGRNAGDKLVQAHAALESYSTAYWWSAGFFAVGAVLTLLLYRSGVPKADENAAPTVHM